MGSALAARFLAAGHDVLGFDLEAARLSELRAINGRPAQDVREVAAGCRRLVLSLPNTDVVQSVVRQMSQELRQGQIIIDTTTGDPRQSAEIGRTLAAQGVAYLDATVSGSSEQARRGEVVVMAGGQAEALAQCEDLFRLFARRTYHLGSWGAGARMKLVTNLVLGLNRAALAEGLSFARALGLEAAEALEVLLASPAYSRIMETKGAKMVQGDFQPVARLSQHLKDVRLILQVGAEARARLPLTKVHQQLLEQAEAAGLGGADNSALIRVFELEA
jgi:3-hydroxyisobutyrate dehydrogenase-like beta-hydroxyacid dehydrogenase